MWKMNLGEKRAAQSMLLRWRTLTRFCLRTPTQFCLGQYCGGCACHISMFKSRGFLPLSLKIFLGFIRLPFAAAPSQPTSLSHFALEETKEDVTRWDPYLDPTFEADG